MASVSPRGHFKLVFVNAVFHILIKPLRGNDKLF